MYVNAPVTNMGERHLSKIVNLSWRRWQLALSTKYYQNEYFRQISELREHAFVHARDEI
jgi:hypothetical protein